MAPPPERSDATWAALFARTADLDVSIAAVTAAVERLREEGPE